MTIANRRTKRQSIYGGNDPRFTPRYGLTQASSYLKIPQQTLNNWVYGRYYPIKGKETKKYSPPLIKRPEESSPLLSFVNLTEAHILVGITQVEKIRMEKVRPALSYLAEKFNFEHPLLEFEFQTNGVDLFVDHLGDIINVSKSGQLALKEVIKIYLHRIKRDRDNVPELLFPFPKRISSKENALEELRQQLAPVSINPLVSFGRPILVGSGVPTEIVYDRFQAGDSISDLADDYGIEKGQVEEAVRYETPTIKAA